MASKKVRIGGYSAMWGDIPMAYRQLIEKGNCDYLIGDYLAELTMAILSRQRTKDPKMGYASAIVQMVTETAPSLKAKGIKVVCNAGGMNPLACREMLQTVCEKAGAPLKIAAVVGDDITERIGELRTKGVTEMYTGETIPDVEIGSANAYFGAKPIAAALSRGCDIVVTGRCVDSALVLGILMHEFGWRDDDYDKLCMGTCAGHLLECSAQSTGGLFTDWLSQKWDNIGYPVAEVSSDGSFTLSKPPRTDGIVCFGSVAEQLVYEIQDPGAYHVPDVACDFTSVKIEELGENLVRVSGGKGLAPTDSYKVCCTVPDDFAAVLIMLIVGQDAAAKARRTHETILGRARRLLQKMGAPDFVETRFEALGASHFDPNGDERSATEVVAKIGLKHKDPRAIGLYQLQAVAAGVSMAQGTTTLGGTGVSSKASPVMRVFSLLIPKTSLTCEVVVDNDRFPVAVPTSGGFPGSASLRLSPLPSASPQGELETVPLLRLCWARSGDKGNLANVGLVARRREYLPLLRHLITADRVKAYFSKRVRGKVERFEMPGIGAMNFLLHDCLGGGGMASLHSDPLAKTFGQVLLLMKVDVPKAWGLAAESKL